MSYENFVMRQARNQRCHRTLSEAFRDADYGTAIWRCETANEKATNVLLWLFTSLVFGFIFGLFVAPILS